MNADRIGVYANPNNTLIDTDLHLRRVKCAICGKSFEADTELYTYKRGDYAHKPYYYCSYTCYRKWEKPMIEKSNKKTRRELWEAENLYDYNGNRIRRTA